MNETEYRVESSIDLIDLHVATATRSLGQFVEYVRSQDKHISICVEPGPLIRLEKVRLPSGEGLEEWDGCCLELVNKLLHDHPAGRILYVELPRSHRWRYHAALVLNGLVYDAWHPEAVLPPEEYIKTIFGEAEDSVLSWEIIEEEET